MSVENDRQVVATLTLPLTIPDLVELMAVLERAYGVLNMRSTSDSQLVEFTRAGR